MAVGTPVSASKNLQLILCVLLGYTAPLFDTLATCLATHFLLDFHGHTPIGRLNSSQISVFGNLTHWLMEWERMARGTSEQRITTE